jgi:hypothetical protein
MKEEFEHLERAIRGSRSTDGRVPGRIQRTVTKDKPSYGVTTINNLRLRGENGERAIVEGALI